MLKLQINTRPLSKADVPMLSELDKGIFPSEMLLDTESYEQLSSLNGGILIECLAGELPVGAAFAFPATAMEQELREENDPLFEVLPYELYSYSVGVLPKYQGSYAGAMLMRALIREAKRQGYAFVSLHVRVEGGVAEKYKKVFKPVASRLVPNYWGEGGEMMEYQLIDLWKL